MRHRLANFILRSAILFVLVFAFVPVVPAQTLKPDTLKGMKWRLVGPFRGGRALAVAGIPGDANTYYFGAVAGGVWKTTSGGLQWTPIFDKEPVSSIGSIAVAPSDPNVIYVGTGEACIRGNISFGDGVYKSVDAGKTWTHIGLDDTRHIGRVIVDPHNSDIVFVAALGHAYGSNEERGVFRSTDGGKHWDKVLYKDQKTGAIDITFDPGNSHILYAALWQAVRTPWSLDSGGPGSGLYKSSDGGATWKELKGHGLPEGVYGRIGVAAAPGGERVYALIEAKEGGLFRSDDAGDSWKKITADHRFTQRAWYFTHIFADPKNADEVYILNTGMYRSTDAGATFSTINAPHGDRHGLWIDPLDTDRMIESDDGGATVTADGGKTWTTEDNQPTAQFYHIATDNRFLYRLYGAQQDNSTVSIASRSDRGAITGADYYEVGGGESGFVVPDPRNPDIVYAGSYDGLITRFDKKDGQEQDISAWPLNPMGHAAAKLVHRFQWTAPIALSPEDPNVIYHGGEVLFKSTDAGMSWTAISPDLTRNDKSKQQSSGGPITQDNTSIEYYDTIFAIAESPLEKGLIWVGTDDGLVQLTRDGGKNWSNVTPKDLPEWSMISLIDPSPHDAGTAYVAVDRHRLDDFKPYIYKTTEYGKQWTKLVNGIPDTAYVHAVREDPKRKGLLYAGTETGIYVSYDDGANWQSLQMNLPQTPIDDLIVHDNDLVVATHGRAFWILDDITPLRQLQASTQDEDVKFFAPEAAYRTRIFSFPLRGESAGANPPSGAILDYWLKDAPKDEIKLDILDAKGNVIRKFSSKKPKQEEGAEENPFRRGGSETIPAEKGLNRFVWDLRYEPATKVPGLVVWGGSGAGPFAVPGKYQAKLIAAGKDYTVSFEIKEDPRVPVTQAGLEKQLELGLKIRDRLSEAHKAVNEMKEVQAQIAALKKRVGDESKAKPAVSAADDLNKKIESIEAGLVQLKSKSGEDSLNFPIMPADQLQALLSTVDGADTAPTAQSYTVYDRLNGEIAPPLEQWSQTKSKDLPALNKEISKAGISIIAVTPSKED
ncbi:MAG TPA: hypothetical protein VJR26_07815 [Candidatus Acidoferrales bacterium]|nr:hypothetical protein [Candidatus Acidoferrales bacterium]